MENLNKKALLVAVIFSLATTGMIYLYLSSFKKAGKVVEVINVYYLIKTLEPKHKITEVDIVSKPVEKELLNKNVIINKSDAIGKYVKERVYQGEQLLIDRLVTEKDFLLAYSISKNERAVTIDVDEKTEVANLLMPGDFVDVVASFDEEKRGEEVVPKRTSIIIQSVRILALGQEQSPDDIKKEDLPKTVTLAVTVEQAERLVYASHFGSIRLVLRPFNDNEEIKTKGVRSDDFIRNK